MELLLKGNSLVLQGQWQQQQQQYQAAAADE
jgi:hypothetical protein